MFRGRTEPTILNCLLRDVVEKPLGGAVVGRHSAWSVVLFSAFLKAEKAVRFNSLALAPSISASTTNSSPAFLTEPFAGSCPRACWIVRASERVYELFCFGFFFCGRLS